MSNPARSGVLASMVRWLSKGYPEGVPPQDRIPLIALLRHRLTNAELDQIVGTLIAGGQLPVDGSAIDAAIAQVADQQPTAEDISRVGARLAAAGWPLAGSPDSPAVESGDEPAEQAPADGNIGTSDRPAVLRAIIGWLRSGYPMGVPEQDYVPLFALLRRRLSDEEISSIVDQLVQTGPSPFGAVDIGVLITKLTNEMPSEADVTRVRDRLEAVGWGVAPNSD